VERTIMSYLLLKYLHVLSMVLLFGTGLGSAFYKWMADRSRNVAHIAATNRHVVLADWLFTTPTVIFQPLSGIWMLHVADIPLGTPWVAASLALYLLAGVCWLIVVGLQIGMKNMARQAVLTQSELPSRYWRHARLWFWLGVPAFISMVMVVFMMVFKSLPGA
jgi:uncharacterized membrane protein